MAERGRGGADERDSAPPWWGHREQWNDAVALGHDLRTLSRFVRQQFAVVWRCYCLSSIR